MYHYNFTNDLRIDNLDSKLKEVADAFLNNAVPSANDDKSKNNNYNTIGYYFNLKAKGNCARLSASNNTKKVVLNFIKKFQFPNPRTQFDLQNSHKDNILLSPMREIVKLLYVLFFIDPLNAYIEKEEIQNFIFYNSEIAKRKNYNIINTAYQIIQYRRDGKLPANIDTDSGSHIWNHQERQLREMVKVLLYTGCFIETNGKMQINIQDANKDNKSDLLDIITYNSYWEYDESKEFDQNKESYQIYMDNDLTDENWQDSNLQTYTTSEIPYSRNRIIFGAPGTGKSRQLNDDAEKFFNQENDNDSDKNKIFAKIHTAFTNNNNFLQVLNAIGFSYCAEIKTLLNGNTSKKNIAETFFKDKEEHIKKRSADAFYFPLITKKEDFKYSGNGDFKSFFESKIQEFQKKQVGQETEKTSLFNALGYYNSEEIRVLLGLPKETDIENYNVVQMTIPEAQWLWRGVSAAQIELEMNYVERVTFHPNYSYAHFVGTYKPVQDKDDPKQIRYEYVPGPFMRTLTKALNNPGSNFLLIIEEINRANVAAVFGDVFQMLDRDDKGASEYPIAASEDIKKYLKDEIKTGNIDLEQIRIPSNMYIWATMNSADQGVFPMDAAFKRRWNFEYLGIDENENEVQNYYIPMGKDRNVSWNDFRKALNNKLSENGTNEDKLLGPFFLSSKDLENALKDREAFIKLFKSKVLMYLFEDVVKMNPGKLFADIGNNPMRYSGICKAFDEKGEKIFGFSLEQNNDGTPS